MGNQDYLADLDYPSVREVSVSPAVDILRQMRFIFTADPGANWFTYICNLLSLLDSDCEDPVNYEHLGYLVAQHPALALFHSMLVEEFVPALVRTLHPRLSAAYPWDTASDQTSDTFIQFSCQRERQMEPIVPKDEPFQRYCAVRFIVEELHTPDGATFIEKQSCADQLHLVTLMDRLYPTSSTESLVVECDSAVLDLADDFAGAMQI